MSMMHPHDRDEHSEHNGNGKSWLFSRTGLATICALAILGFLVYEGHGAHILGFAPYLLILACPLMHIFMHHDHHHHDHMDDDLKDNSSNTNENKKHKGGCH